MKKNCLLFVLLFLCITSQVAFSSGWGDYNVELINGYKLIRTNYKTIMIWDAKESQCVVPPKIVALNIKDDIVFGKTEYSPDSDLPSIQGFFILDTATGHKELEISESQWINLLRLKGISGKPRLMRPSRFFMSTFYRILTSRFLLIICFVVVLICFFKRKFFRNFKKASSAR